MKKSKKRLLPILLLTVLTLQIMPAQSPISSRDSGPGLKAEREKTYSEAEVNELLAAVATEADAAIEEAYAAGYKAAMLEVYPETARLESLNNSLRAELEKETLRVKLPMWIMPVTIIVSGVAGFIFAQCVK